MFDAINILSVAYKLKSHNPSNTPTNDCGFFINISSLSSPLLLRIFPHTFAFIPIPGMTLSSLNRSIYAVSRLISPYSVQVCEGMNYSKTGVPWQIKSILIIDFSYLEMPYFAPFCKVLLVFYQSCNFGHSVTLLAYRCLSWQNISVCSSQIVVSLPCASDNDKGLTSSKYSIRTWFYP